MMWPPIILTTVFIYYAGAVTKDECLDFTVSDCYVDPSLIIWENDQVGTASLCQFACHNFPSCKEFRFYQDNCQLFSDNYKTSCDIIGGRADKSLEDCTGSVTVGGCDAFIEEECEYLGEDSGFSAPPGEFTSPVECEGYCKGFQVLGAEYWVWGKVDKSCDLLKSSKRTCLGISGPRDPPIEECQTPTKCLKPNLTGQEQRTIAREKEDILPLFILQKKITLFLDWTLTYCGWEGLMLPVRDHGSGLMEPSSPSLIGQLDNQIMLMVTIRITFQLIMKELLEHGMIVI